MDFFKLWGGFFIILKLSEKNYYYVAYRFSMFYLTLNVSFFQLWTILNADFFYYCVSCDIEWKILTRHRTYMHTRACFLTHAHTYVYIHMNTWVSRHSNPLTLKHTLEDGQTQRHSHSKTRTWTCLHSNTLALEHACTIEHTHLKTLALEDSFTRRLFHSKTLSLEDAHTQTLALEDAHSARSLHSKKLTLEDARTWTHTRTHLHLQLNTLPFAHSLMQSHSNTHIHLHAGDLPAHSCLHMCRFGHTENGTHSLTIPHAFMHTHARICTSEIFSLLYALCLWNELFSLSWFMFSAVI